MLARSLCFGLLPLLGSVFAQTSSSYTDSENGIIFQGLTDPTYDVTYGLAFPTSTTGDEFIGEIVAPIAAKWIGVALGGAMNGDLLLVGWPNGNDIVSTTRQAQNYVQPTTYSGPVITDLPSTSVNSTHWKWVFRCQNCTTWTVAGQSGGLTQTGVSVLAWAYSTVAVDDPSDPDSTFQEHTDFGFWGENLADAHQSAYSSWVSAGSATTATAPAKSTAPTTSKPATTSPVTTAKTGTAPSSTPTGTVAKYGQCGGIGYTGPTTCASGSTCTVSNSYYSQCL